MVQENEANLEYFEEAFTLLKTEVNTKRINVHTDSEDDESPTESPTTLSISAPPTPASSTNQLKESLALLELDFAEFKELTQASLSDYQDTTVQQLKRDNQVLESDLRGSVVALKQENNMLRIQLAKVKEDAENRERSFTRKVQHLTDQLSAVPTVTTTETQILPASVPNPCLLAVSMSVLCTSPTTPWQLLIHPHSQPPTASSTHPSCPPLSQKNKLLGDSNGKFLDTNKPFPGKKKKKKKKKVLLKRCSTTGQAMKL